MVVLGVGPRISAVREGEQMHLPWVGSHNLKLSVFNTVNLRRFTSWGVALWWSMCGTLHGPVHRHTRLSNMESDLLAFCSMLSDFLSGRLCVCAGLLVPFQRARRRVRDA